MAELYTTGTNRIVYRSVGFTAGLTVTGYLWNPSKVKSDLQTFTEVELGLYHLDFDFSVVGTWMGVFYENDVAKASGVFRVTELAPEAGGNIAAIKAKTDVLPSGIPKNVALSNFAFLMILKSDHVTPATGKTVTAEISKDGGAFASCDQSVAEVGNGVYKIDLIQTEMNADVIALKFTETDCDQRTVTILTSG